MTGALPPSDRVHDALTALVEWYAAMGVDAVLADAPVDRFAETAADMVRRSATRTAAEAPRAEQRRDPRASAGNLPPPQPSSAPAAATVPSGDAVLNARAAAASADSLEALKALLARFDGCNLKLTAKNLVFGDGNPSARLMFVGEAPGRDEDEAGRPFVGRSGKLLDVMLTALGLDRMADTYIANVVYWRPPGNRDPSDQEVAICKPFIERQIELVKPDILVFLGGQPMKALIGGDAARSGIRKLRGRWHTFETGGRTIAALPTFHPAYLLRNPIEKRLVWRDLLAVRERLRQG
jgi:uracil-DNA glycosylase family 4